MRGGSTQFGEFRQAEAYPSPPIDPGVTTISYEFINRKLGNYLLLCRLAVGGQSEVFLAQKQGPGSFDRPVVIKALPSEHRGDEKFVEPFHREAFLSARFSHPHVITVHDARVLEDEQCMIMDFISGQTVADIAQRGYKAGEPPSTDRAVRIISDACDGLHYTHNFRGLDETEYSVVHRDVSPQNIMVTYQGNTLVFDFGIAKIGGRDEDVETLAGGKYAYMSPEQCLGDPVDSRSDIFSLGVILYELTVGKRLFRRETDQEVVEAVTEERIEPPGAVRSKFPTMLENTIMKALQRDPDRRYQTAGRMRDDLRDFLSLQSGESDRGALGNYVANLFESERSNIADLVEWADDSDEGPEPVGEIPLEKLGREDVDLDQYESGRSEESMQIPESEGPDEEPNSESHAVGADEAVPEGRRSAPPNGENSERRVDCESELASDTGSGGAPDGEVYDELEQMRERQSVLYVALVLLSLLAIGLSIVTVYVGADGDQHQPAEIEDPNDSGKRGG